MDTVFSRLLVYKIIIFKSKIKIWKLWEDLSKIWEEGSIWDVMGIFMSRGVVSLGEKENNSSLQLLNVFMHCLDFAVWKIDLPGF